MALNRKKFLNHKADYFLDVDADSESHLDTKDPMNSEKETRWLKNNHKWKILSFLSLIFAFYFSSRMNSYLSIDLNASVPVRNNQGSDSEKFTIRMNTFRRNELLKLSIDSISKCPGIAQIQIVWSDRENEPPDMSFFSKDARNLVVFEKHATDSLNNRFKPLLDISTDGIFSVDDDLVFHCEDLTLAFDTWRSSRMTIVGFSPRLVTNDKTKGLYTYHPGTLSAWFGAYNIILTKAAFFDKKYLSLYWKLPQTVLDHIDSNRNCEDIAMSMVVAKESNMPPVWVNAKVKDLGKIGISSGGDHISSRTYCIEYFELQLRKAPLILSRVVSYRASSLWFWTN